MPAAAMAQPGRIPRPPNSFLLYRKDTIQRLQEEDQNLGLPRRPQSELSKVVGNLWKNEAEHTKSEYILRAAKRKAEHQKAYPDYQYRPLVKRRKLDEEKNVDRSGSLSWTSSSSPSSSGSLPEPVTPTTHAAVLPNRKPQFAGKKVYSLDDDALIYQINASSTHNYIKHNLPHLASAMATPTNATQPRASGSTPRPPDTNVATRHLQLETLKALQSRVLAKGKAKAHTAVTAPRPRTHQVRWDVECAPLDAGFCDIAAAWERVTSQPPAAGSAAAPDTLAPADLQGQPPQTGPRTGPAQPLLSSDVPWAATTLDGMDMDMPNVEFDIDFTGMFDDFLDPAFNHVDPSELPAQPIDTDQAFFGGELDHLYNGVVPTGYAAQPLPWSSSSMAMAPVPGFTHNEWNGVPQPDPLEMPPQAGGFWPQGWNSRAGM